jgi:hypothetical protein
VGRGLAAPRECASWARKGSVRQLSLWRRGTWHSARASAVTTGRRTRLARLLAGHGAGWAARGLLGR